LAQQVFEQRVETVDVAKAEQALDVARKERIHPLAVKRRLFAWCQQRGGQATVKQPLWQRDAEGRQLVP